MAGRKTARLVTVHYCDRFGRRIGVSGPAWSDALPPRSANVRRRLWLNLDEVELHCREVKT